jgi:hypothetical protein
VYFEGAFLFMNIPPRELKRFYTYSLSVGAKLCHLVSVRSLQLLRRCKISLMSRDLHMFRLVHIVFALFFMMANSHGCALRVKCLVGLGYHLVLGPLFRNTTTLELYLAHNFSIVP